MSVLKMTYRHGQNRQLPQILTIILGCLLFLSNGMMFAWTSPSIPRIISDETLNITFEEASYFTVIPPAAMIFTAPVFSYFINRLGRKWTLLLTAIPHLLTWAITAVAYNVATFYGARIMCGIADAATFAVVPVYIGEISEPTVRGSWGNLMSISMYVGKFIVNTVGSFESVQNTAIICGSIPLLYAVLCVLMPESPYFLLMRGKENEAKDALKRLRWRDDVEYELESIKSDIARQISESGTMKDLFTIKSNRKAIFMCIGLRFAQIYCGLSAFETYTQYTFEEAGGFLSPKTSAIIFTAMFVICISLSTFIIDKFGRRPLMMVSSLGCAIILTIESVYFCLKQYMQMDLHFLNWLPFAAMIAFIIFCSIGLGFLPTLMSSELLSASVKGKATAIIIVFQALSVLSGPKLFQTLTYNYGIASSFILFSCCTYVSAILSHFFLVETKGKTLEEVQQELKGNVPKNCKQPF